MRRLWVLMEHLKILGFQACIWKKIPHLGSLKQDVLIITALVCLLLKLTAPEFHFSEEVVEWLKKLVHALSYLKTVDANAGIKVDVNVNLTSPKN